MAEKKELPKGYVAKEKMRKDAKKERDQTQIDKIKEQLKPDNKIKAIIEKKAPALKRNKGGRPLKYTVERVQKGVDEYIASCFEPKRSMFGDAITDEFGDVVYEQIKPFTLEGFDAWIGWDRDIRLDYEAREPFSNTLKRLRELVYGFAVESLWKGQATGVIFNLKNNWGWTDKVVHENLTKLEDVLMEQEKEMQNPVQKPTTSSISENKNKKKP